VRIGQLAAQTGYSVRTIRFYEQSGLIPAPDRTRGGYRSYGEDAVTRLRFVRSAQAQALGLSLAEIADVLRIRDHQGPPCSYVAELLDTHISALDTRINELTALRDELRARHPLGTAPDPARCNGENVSDRRTDPGARAGRPQSGPSGRVPGRVIPQSPRRGAPEITAGAAPGEAKPQTATRHAARWDKRTWRPSCTARGRWSSWSQATAGSFPGTLCTPTRSSSRSRPSRRLTHRPRFTIATIRPASDVTLHRSAPDCGRNVRVIIIAPLGGR
jgi:MerR family copper efflux transcriptional regulator